MWKRSPTTLLAVLCPITVLAAEPARIRLEVEADGDCLTADDLDARLATLGARHARATTNARARST